MVNPFQPPWWTGPWVEFCVLYPFPISWHREMAFLPHFGKKTTLYPNDLAGPSSCARRRHRLGFSPDCSEHLSLSCPWWVPAFPQDKLALFQQETWQGVNEGPV